MRPNRPNQQFLFVSLLMSLCFSSLPATADFADGLAAFQSGDYARALEEWKPLADAGDLAAMRNLGHMFRNGLGVEPDPRRAANYFRQAAERGLTGAQVQLADLYLRGEGVSKNRVEAARWFHQAALKGDSTAQYYMGLLTETGTGVTRSQSSAMGWYNLAARNGHKEAADRMAQLVTRSEQNPQIPPAPPEPSNTNSNQVVSAIPDAPDKQIITATKQDNLEARPDASDTTTSASQTTEVMDVAADTDENHSLAQAEENSEKPALLTDTAQAQSDNQSQSSSQTQGLGQRAKSFFRSLLPGKPSQATQSPESNETETETAEVSPEANPASKINIDDTKNELEIAEAPVNGDSAPEPVITQEKDDDPELSDRPNLFGRITEGVTKLFSLNQNKSAVETTSDTSTNTNDTVAVMEASKSNVTKDPATDVKPDNSKVTAITTSAQEPAAVKKVKAEMITTRASIAPLPEATSTTLQLGSQQRLTLGQAARQLGVAAPASEGPIGKKGLQPKPAMVFTEPPIDAAVRSLLSLSKADATAVWQTSLPYQ